MFKSSCPVCYFMKKNSEVMKMTAKYVRLDKAGQQH